MGRPNPSACYLYRSTNSQWQGGNGAFESYGLGPLQHYVDFDLLGDTFRVSFTGGLGSTGVDAPGMQWNIRIGGDWAPSQVPGFLPITGDLVPIGLTGAIPAFGVQGVSVVVTNIWTGVKLVQLTGGPGLGAFALRPTLLILPGDT
jgi:hypothetical protein